MSGFIIFFIVMAAMFVVGFALQKNGELAGLGRNPRGKMRAPHGRLVRVKRLDAFTELPFLAKFGRVAPIMLAATLLICILCIAGLISFSSPLPVSLDLLVVVGIGCALVQSDAGIWRSLAWALFGYFICGLIATLLGLYALPLVMSIDTGGINALSMVFGTLGCSACVAAMPLMRTYAREFADGHVDSLKVSSVSMAARAFDALEDPTWKPPADRVPPADEVDNVRALMEKRRRKANDRDR